MFLKRVQTATMSDLPKVVAVYECAIQHMNENGIYQWDEKYPNEKILRDDIIAQNLHLYIVENKIASVFVLNKECDPEYSVGNWTDNEASFAVVHRLCVHPHFQHKGIGTRTMLTAEALLMNRGLQSVRLDAFSENPAALRLYEKLGYQRTGSVRFRKGLFFLFEKSLLRNTI